MVRKASAALASSRYAVSIADLDKAAGLETVQHIHKQGGQAMFLCVDVADAQQVRHWVELTEQELGSVDVLINNAAISHGGSMLELALADFDRVLAVNLRGTFVCSQEVGKRMQRQGAGCIINIASTRALMSEADTEAYAASKGGILALTHAMAVSLGRHGVRVNAISPGWIETGPWQYSVRAVTPHHSERDRAQHPVGSRRCRRGLPVSRGAPRGLHHRPEPHHRRWNDG